MYLTIEILFFVLEMYVCIAVSIGVGWMMGYIPLIFAWKSSPINLDFAQSFDLTIIWHALLTV